MANEKDPRGPSGAAGQQKLHKVKLPDGTVEDWTQEQWRTRDKTAGAVRVDEDGTEIPEPPETP